MQLLAAMPLEPFIGGWIGNVGFVAMGAYFTFLRPKALQKQVGAGMLSEEEAQARIRKVPRWVGYGFIAFGMLKLVMDCTSSFEG